MGKQKKKRSHIMAYYLAISSARILPMWVALKGLSRIYQQADIDVYSNLSLDRVYTNNKDDNIIGFLKSRYSSIRYACYPIRPHYN